ncbi:MAG TPA: polyprenyl synthetase family protein [Bacillota bacterium]
MGVRSSVVADLFDEVWPEVEEVEHELYRQFQGDDALLVELATHLLKGGGKRLRPALVLLAARAFTYRPERLIPVAAAVEMIHMATLVHDDIVDRATLRRGLPTINAKWGEDVSVLLGDYLFARAFSMLADTGDNRVVRIMADVVFRMSAGELEQLAKPFNLQRDEDGYLEHIDKKTAYFIGQCCRLGAMLGEAPEPQAEALHRYGYAIGMGFQIIDDILDFTGSAEELGKPRCADVQSGVLTLPILYALRHADAAAELKALLGRRRFGAYELERILTIVSDCGGLDYAFAVADRFIGEAKAVLSALPAGSVRERLHEIADFVTHRRF